MQGIDQRLQDDRAAGVAAEVQPRFQVVALRQMPAAEDAGLVAVAAKMGAPRHRPELPRKLQVGRSGVGRIGAEDGQARDLAPADRVRERRQVARAPRVAVRAHGPAIVHRPSRRPQLPVQGPHPAAHVGLLLRAREAEDLRRVGAKIAGQLRHESPLALRQIGRAGRAAQRGRDRGEDPSQPRGRHRQAVIRHRARRGKGGLEDIEPVGTETARGHPRRRAAKARA